MNITYDKTKLKIFQEFLKLPKKKYALKYSFAIAFNTAVTIPFILYVVDGQYSFNKLILIFLLLFIPGFIIGYFIALKQWQNMNDTYQESLEYFKENNPDFIKDILEENINNDK